MEIWKAIPEYNGFYEASSMGRIRSVDRATKHPRNQNMTLLRKGHILKTELDKSGYPVVTLSVNGKTKTHKVHRLVAKAFIDNPNNLPQIDHINAKRYDNRPENLRWCSAQENTKWRDEKYSIGDRAKYRILCKENHKVFSSTYEAAFWIIQKGIPEKTTNYKTVSKSIRSACTGRNHTAYTFHWTYIEGSTTSS